METLGERLRYYREEAGLNQKKATSELGLNHPPVLSNYERNERLPDINFLKTAAISYGVTLDELTGLSEHEVMKQIYRINVFKKRMKYLREQLGYSTEELASITELNEEDIINFEEKIKEFPRREITEKLSQALNCTPDYLIGEVEERYVFKDGSKLTIDITKFIMDNDIEYNQIKLDDVDKNLLQLSLQFIFYNTLKQNRLKNT